MRLLFIITLIFLVTTSVQSQLNIWLGPFPSTIPDPLATSQEQRATDVDKKMLPKVTVMAANTQTVRKYVMDNEDSLGEISIDMMLKKSEVNKFLNDCIGYIIAKNSIAGSIPGMSKLAAKLKLIAFTKTRKIRSLKKELKDAFETDNYMTEGERKVLLLDIIERALKITI